jgi:prostaglandin-endoperoxide synthase 2
VLSNKSTCLFPAFAQYLTDGFIRTRMPKPGEDPRLRLKNNSNHQIDLSPLYGRTLEQTTALRLGSQAANERGRLKSQMIGSEEYSPFLYDANGTIPTEFACLDMPLGLVPNDPTNPNKKLFAAGGDRVNAAPLTAMMNTLFLREHNRLAGQLGSRNPTWDDERVFQTARNIVIVMFIKIVVEEYISHISPVPFRLRADPSVAWNAPWNKPNWITTEFSLLYRWHSLIPEAMTWGQIQYPAGATILNNQPLLAEGLANAFKDVSAQKAGKLGAFNTTEALIPFEERAIAQGRLARLAPYTAYRTYVSLSVPRKFNEISSNPDVVAFLKNVYSSPAEIDFYVGLFAEDVGDNSPLPELLSTMVGLDAFSQALTNPLLSEHVFKESTFTPYGWTEIQKTQSLRDVLVRNIPQGIGSAFVGMTQSTWQFSL